MRIYWKFCWNLVSTLLIAGVLSWLWVLLSAPPPASVPLHGVSADRQTSPALFLWIDDVGSPPSSLDQIGGGQSGGPGPPLVESEVGREESPPPFEVEQEEQTPSSVELEGAGEEGGSVEPPTEGGSEAAPQIPVTEGETEEITEGDRTRADAAAGDLRSTIRFHAYRFSYPALGLVDIPVARPSMTYWARREWERLEDQLQAAMRQGLTVYPHSPLLGDPGNIVIAGHSSPPSSQYNGAYGQVFASLPRSQPGDRIVVEQGDQRLTYEVTRTRVVSATATDILLQGQGNELTIITCYPIGTTQSRFVVQARLTDPAPSVGTGHGEGREVAMR